MDKVSGLSDHPNPFNGVPKDYPFFALLRVLFFKFLIFFFAHSIQLWVSLGLVSNHPVPVGDGGPQVGPTQLAANCLNAYLTV